MTRALRHIAESVLITVAIFGSIAGLAALLTSCSTPARPKPVMETLPPHCRTTIHGTILCVVRPEEGPGR